MYTILENESYNAENLNHEDLSYIFFMTLSKKRHQIY